MNTVVQLSLTSYKHYGVVIVVNVIVLVLLTAADHIVFSYVVNKCSFEASESDR